MQALILAGGKGTRLRPYTVSLPKPLVPVGDRPIAEILIRQLREHGFREIVISIGHLAELVEAYFGDGRRWGLRVRYVREDKPLGTAGPLRLAQGLDRDFLVLNGDVLTDADFSGMMRAHKAKKAAATLGVSRREVKIDFGIIRMDGGSRFAEYVEKPSYEHHVSMGINVFNRRVRRHIRPGEALGIPDLVERVHHAGERVECHVHAGRWLDIGRIEDFQKAQDLFEKDGRKLLPPAP